MPWGDVSKKKQWDGPIKAWRASLEAIGCTLTRSPDAYEIAKVDGPGVRGIIYPHKQGYGTHHSARFRDCASKDKAAFDRAAGALGLWVKNRGAHFKHPD